MLVGLLFLAVIFLAYFNGANDNFKGVATLYGSGTVSYKTAITLATLATFAGSLSALFLAQGLVDSFSGKGLVPEEITATPVFLTAVALGAGSTVLLATRLGFPISTTHSLVGGLLGAGLMSVGWNVNFSTLGSAFFIPLLISPFIAFILGMSVYWLLTKTRIMLGITKETCICVGEEKEYVPLRVIALNQSAATNIEHETHKTSLTMAEESKCVDIYTDKLWGVYVQKLLDIAHTISAAAVSFARGLNDTPKIAGLLVAVEVLNLQFSMTAIALGMAIGGLLNARKVAETVSHKITKISHSQGFSANLVTSFLVIVASKFGVPVSTTHVSVGSIFGISMVSSSHNAKMITNIILSWLITLPVAALFSAIAYFIIPM
ncbi:inorganic phosphate transporter [Haliea sp. AH-315-K21]|uniref:Phosphate transporter n=1 Tax=SAR86 cluster bacterium TaxID=2030880 RepID=A0A2A5CG89_9GAMM|nr:inorganic phosphate transporter [Haliea sp. AH-315-K21]PCJ42879.1 MAG: phosphate permease [SAR86 cluster bacterium]